MGKITCLEQITIHNSFGGIYFITKITIINGIVIKWVCCPELTTKSQLEQVITGFILPFKTFVAMQCAIPIVWNANGIKLFLPGYFIGKYQHTKPKTIFYYILITHKKIRPKVQLIISSTMWIFFQTKSMNYLIQ
jgi:hypothetical protein